jgi:hypothetical protein
MLVLSPRNGFLISSGNLHPSFCLIFPVQLTLISRKKEGAIMHTTTLGIDVAKNVFQLHAGWMREGAQCLAGA